MAEAESHFLWWNLGAPGAGRMRRQLAQLRRELDPLPEVLAFAELLGSSIDALREELPDYTVVAPAGELSARTRRSALAVRGPAEPLPVTERFTVPDRHHVPEARGFKVWLRSIVSARTEFAGQEVEVHAVHIPNGSDNGWGKIDHLWALRYGLEDSELPQVVGSDLNTPQAERDGEIITFGQNWDGSFPTRAHTRKPFTPERPQDFRAWDEGERAVLEGLPRDLDMVDAFRELHPADSGFTWGPAPKPPDRRLDHVFASRRLDLRHCRHLDDWRAHRLSDHCPIVASFAPAR